MTAMVEIVVKGCSRVLLGLLSKPDSYVTVTAVRQILTKSAWLHGPNAWWVGFRPTGRMLDTPDLGNLLNADRSPLFRLSRLSWTVSNNNNNNNNSHDNVYGAVIMTQSHCESSPGSSDECRLSAGWLPTLRPSQSTWAVSPPKIGSYHPHPPSSLLLLLSP